MAQRPRPRFEVWLPVVFLFGLAVSVAMLVSSQVKGDQLTLLARGWLLVYEGEWVPFGSPASGGGKVPGGLTSLLVGLPLWLWPDHRAPVVVILVSHLAAYLLLDTMVRRIFGPEERLLLAVFYWLNPWRLFYSGFLWTPGYLFFLGVLHTWTVYRQRRQASFWVSAVHVLVIGCALQLHLSAVLLAVASLLLWWRGYFRPHLGGAALGATIVAASLVPWLLAVQATADLPLSEGRFVSQLLRAPVSAFRVVSYWLRYPSLVPNRTIRCFDLVPNFGENAAAVQGLLEAQPLTVILYLTVAVSLWANYRFWSGAARWWRPLPAEASDRDWLAGVARWTLATAVLVSIALPGTIMSFHVLLLLHLAVVPVLVVGGALLRGARSRPAWRGVAIYGVLSGVLALTILAASPLYRCGGRTCSKTGTLPSLRGDHRMLDDLGIRESCPPVVNDPKGWWPDALPEPEPPSPQLQDGA